jgi:GNAT superfamily N-acetyltransferase
LKIVVLPLSAVRFGDLEALFAARGCSIARGCWCMYYRETGKTVAPPATTVAEHRKQQLRALAGADPPPGLIGYRGGTPVGWVTLGPREGYARLARSPIMKPVDAAPVWSIVCFVVPREFRGQGVATALLEGAIAYARRRGVRLLEAYPIDKPRRSQDDWMWHGALSMYAKAGFAEVARRRPHRPVVRLALRPVRLRAAR